MLHLKSYLPQMRQGAALDVGTRLGEFAFTLAELMPGGSRVIGMDCDSKVMEQAEQKHAGKGIEFLTGDAMDMPFADNSFELVAISNTLHHIEHYERVLEEMLRVLRPGGYLLVNEMFSDNQNAAQQTHFAQHSLEAKLDVLSGGFQRPTWKREEIITILDRLPLEEVHTLELREEPEMDKKLAAKTEKLTETVEKMAAAGGERDALLAEARAIQARFRETGIQRCTQLVYYGKKG